MHEARNRRYAVRDRGFGHGSLNRTRSPGISRILIGRMHCALSARRRWNMELYTWDEMEKEVLSGTIARKIVSGDKAMVAQVFLAKGAIVPEHHHESEQITYTSKAENTLRGYRSDWRDFCAWCAGHGLCPLPALPETVASYIAGCAEHLKPGSIQRRLNAIAEAHKAVGLDSPTHTPIVANTMKGIRRTKGTAPTQKAAALTDDIRAMVRTTSTGIIGARDRALILLGFAGAFRRSELVGLDV